MFAVQFICSVYATGVTSRFQLPSFTDMFLTKGNKELGIIRILRPIIGHSDKPSVSIPQSRVNFILEWFFGQVL
jgi:hypothetical protein